MIKYRDKHIRETSATVRVYEYKDNELNLNELSRLSICVVCKATLSGRIQQNLHAVRTQWKTMHQILTTTAESGRSQRCNNNTLESRPPSQKRKSFIDVMMLMPPTSGIERPMGSIPIT